MYSLPYFKEGNESIVEDFMEAHPFVMLCGTDSEGKPVATQLPLLIRKKEDRFILNGHIMKQTDHHKAFLNNPNVLAIFTGPHTYVSASWYTNPLQGSTWNYMSVHARGIIHFLDEKNLHETLRETTAHFENNPYSPSLFEKLPEEYINRLSKAIIAIEIEVQQIENVFKLSQNRDVVSYHNIISQLEQGNEGARQIASEMKHRGSQLFKEGSEMP